MGGDDSHGRASTGTRERRMTPKPAAVRAAKVPISITGSMRMSSGTMLALISVVLGLGCRPVSAQDWETFAASSDRSQDSFIIETMKQGELEAQLSLCRGLGRRADSNVEAVIDSLVAGYAPGTASRTELLLRQLLVSARTAHRQDTDLPSWVAANAASLETLLAGMARWRAPMLKVELVSLAAIAGGPAARRALLEAGAGVGQALKGSGGLLSGEETALALAFLEAARRAPSADLLPACADIARLSRDGTVVDAAREAAAACAR
jgi:hypothetical protein